MLPDIDIIDKGHVLNAKEHDELKRYLVEKCRTALRDMGWLSRILIESNPPTGDETEWYAGLWQGRFKREKGRVRAFETVITLNSYFLRDIESMKMVLAHEYGHNWTLGYLIMLDRIDTEDDIIKQRVPWVYYRIRRLDPSMVVPHNNKWEYCDKEILAEDYRCLFSGHRDNHEMAHLFGYPSTEVKDYLSTLCYRRHS
ncbi:MAG: hypothetical protein WC370_07570 [Dehalococcoidales bacterium]|jgi:hypothetical protein